MNEKEVFAAIAYALHEELGKHTHDQESFRPNIQAYAYCLESQDSDDASSTSLVTTKIKLDNERIQV